MAQEESTDQSVTFTGQIDPELLARASQPGEFVPSTMGPMIYLWEFGPDACPTFVTIAANEDSARQAIIRHPQVGEMMAVPDYQALVVGPPTQVIQPEDGVVWVMNWKEADRVEIDG